LRRPRKSRALWVLSSEAIADPGRDATLLAPTKDPAKIRAIFVHPEWVRRGIGGAILKHCEGLHACGNTFSGDLDARFDEGRVGRAPLELWK
jgi:hypothetical protein